MLDWNKWVNARSEHRPICENGKTLTSCSCLGIANAEQNPCDRTWCIRSMSESAMEDHDEENILAQQEETGINNWAVLHWWQNTDWSLMRCSDLSHYLAGRIIRDKENLQKKKSKENKSIRVTMIQKHWYMLLWE